MTYTYIIDIGEALSETKDFKTEEEAIQYGQELFDNSNATYVTLYNKKRQAIKEYS